MTDIWIKFFGRCEDLGLTEIKPGTTMSDVQCGKKIQVALIAGIIACIGVVTGALVILKIRHKLCRYKGKGCYYSNAIDYITRKYR